jgi:hypothetical protein
VARYLEWQKSHRRIGKLSSILEQAESFNTQPAQRVSSTSAVGFKPMAFF